RATPVKAPSETDSMPSANKRMPDTRGPGPSEMIVARLTMVRVMRLITFTVKRSSTGNEGISRFLSGASARVFIGRFEERLYSGGGRGADTSPVRREWR